jgi:hypothetical protein
MVEIKIKIEGLDQLTEALALLSSALAYSKGMENTAKAAEEIMDRLVAGKDKEETIVEEVKATSTEEVLAPAPAPEAPKITIEQIREAFVAKNNIKGNTPKLKAILAEFGARKVTDLQEKDFPEVLKRLEEV